jgi:hypothetical protein
MIQRHSGVYDRILKYVLEKQADENCIELAHVKKQ